MRILIAPDKFKACLTSPEVAAAIAAGLREVDPLAELDLCPIADGGEGTVAALVSATGGRLVHKIVTGPLPEMRVDATLGILGGPAPSETGGSPTSAPHTAVIEMAAASGLHLLRPDQFNPLLTTTFGTGELILEAIRLGCTRIILGIGGSATVDGGIGCLQALSAQIIRGDGSRIGPSDTPLTGQDLPSISTIARSADQSIKTKTGQPVEITVACDVTNPLFGPTGAAAVFGPQKGATPEQVNWLDRALHEFAARTGTLDEANLPGAGAAGGLGFGLMAFAGATLQNGFDLVAKAVDLDARIAAADLVITGEGRLDASSLHGKTAIGVSRICKGHGVPCIALAGAIDREAVRAARDEGLTAAFSICDGPMSLEKAIENARALLQGTAAQLLSVFMADRPSPLSSQLRVGGLRQPPSP